jgi:polyhydroxyalkanoate synthesis regulator phasin
VSTRLKRRIVIAAVVLGVAGLGGTALATSSSGGNSFFNDVARRLGVSPAKLQSAVNGALADRLDQLVKQGKLTRAQADEILKHAKEHGGAFPFGDFGDRSGGPGHFGFRHHGFGPFPGHRPMDGGPFAGAARYLGMSTDDLMKELRSGKTLAAISKAKGKPVSGLESALIAPVKSRLDQAVKDGHLTKAQEKRFLAGITKGIDGFVTHGFHVWMHMGDGFGDRNSGHGSAPAPAAFGL